MTARKATRLAMVGAIAASAALLVGANAGALADTQNDQTQFSVTAGSLAFSSAPAMPTLSTVTLNGQAQNTSTQMTDFAVQDSTGSGSGWNVTVQGNNGVGDSPVFAEYCPGGACGSAGYVNGGLTLPANSLTLNSTSAGFAEQNNSTGSAPTLSCDSNCSVDHGSAVKVASAAVNAGMGTWTTSGWGANSLVLATPTTLKALPSNEVYRVDLVWTLSSGP